MLESLQAYQQYFVPTIPAPHQRYASNHPAARDPILCHLYH
jgi:hypothetical protein